MKRPLEFDLESKLLRVLRDYSSVSGVFGSPTSELLVLEGVQLGACIPDLVVIRERRRGTGKRLKLTSFESWIVGELLRSGSLRAGVLSRRFFTPQSRVSTALARLMRRGVVEVQSDRYFVSSEFSCRFEIASVEAKLTRWREALEQAKSYLNFSDKSFVALPESVVDENPDIEDACEAAGVGLIAVSTNDIELVLKPDSRVAPDSREWVWLLSKTGALTF